MRLKKVKSAKSIIEKSSYIVKDPKTHIGKWKLLFKNNNPINLEIGMGKGDFIINMAQKYKNINFIGIEMYDSVILRAVQKLENKKIDNLKLICMDANLIDEIFDKEISILYLNFSDPWPKARHEKRRLTSNRFLTKYDNIFSNTKTIYQKTDNDELFTYSLESLSNYGYKIKNVSLDLKNSNYKDNVLTEYEKKFNDLNINIKRLEAYKEN